MRLPPDLLPFLSISPIGPIGHIRPIQAYSECYNFAFHARQPEQASFSG